MVATLGRQKPKPQPPAPALLFVTALVSMMIVCESDAAYEAGADVRTRAWSGSAGASSALAPPKWSAWWSESSAEVVVSTCMDDCASPSGGSLGPLPAQICQRRDGFFASALGCADEVLGPRSVASPDESAGRSTGASALAVAEDTPFGGGTDSSVAAPPNQVLGLRGAEGDVGASVGRSCGDSPESGCFRFPSPEYREPGLSDIGGRKEAWLLASCSAPPRRSSRAPPACACASSCSSKIEEGRDTPLRMLMALCTLRAPPPLLRSVAALEMRRRREAASDEWWCAARLSGLSAEAEAEAEVDANADEALRSECVVGETADSEMRDGEAAAVMFDVEAEAAPLVVRMSGLAADEVLGARADLARGTTS